MPTQTQTLEFNAGSGLSLSCKLFAVGNDTVVATASATEKTNDKNRYSVAFTDIPAGAYRMNAFVGAVGGFANELYDLTLTTATFQPRSESSIDNGAIADAVWDESYNQHTTAGTFGKLMDTLRKSNYAVDGTVITGGTPSTTVFRTTLTATTGAYEHAVLFFVTGNCAGENSPILTYNQTNGLVTLEEPLTIAPAVGDEFVIMANNHVHAVQDIVEAIVDEIGQPTVAIPAILESAGFDPTRIIVYRGTTWTIALTDLGDISNLTKIWFTLRKRNNDTESDSIIQVEKTSGLLILNGSTSVTSNQASLSVTDDVAGDITITVKPEATQYISPNDNLIYDIKGRTSAGVVQLLHKSENLIVSADVTRKIS